MLPFIWSWSDQERRLHYAVSGNRRASIRELFVQQLTGLILSGELRPGDRLPTERELAER